MTRRRRTRALRTSAAGVFAGALVAGCAVLVDFDGYDTALPESRTTDAAATEPFVIASVIPKVLSGRSGDAISLSVRLERRSGFSGAVAFGLVAARDLRLEPASTLGSDHELKVVLGEAQGRFTFELTATSADAPGYTARAPIEADVRGAPGSFDVSFGDGGVVELDAFEEIDDVVAPGGTILLSGRGARGTEPFTRLRVTRLADTGDVDLGFGANGYATLDVTVLDPGSTISCVRSASDGVLVAATTGSPQELHVYRLTENGVVDPSYGDGGAAIPIPKASPCHALVVDGRGSLLVGNDAVSRQTPTGSPDLEFGDAGTVRLPIGGTHLIGIDQAGTIHLLTLRATGSGGPGYLRLDARGAPLDGAASALPGLPAGGCLASQRSAGRTPDGRMFVQLDCFSTPGEPTAVATLVAFSPTSIDVGFNRGAPLVSQDSRSTVALTLSSKGLIALAKREGIESTIVTSHAFDGELRWEVRSSTSARAANLAARFATVDGAGRILVVGRLGPRGFVARLWD